MVIPREPNSSNNEGGLRRDYTRSPKISKSYLLGLLHDATVRKTTYRIATKNNDFALIIKDGINFLGSKAWIYKEGKNRNLWIVEFSKSLLFNVLIKSKKEKIDFIRGFFDAEGGIAKAENVRFYLYFCQKERKVLEDIKKYLQEFDIKSGVIHNPSNRIDPDYWRFYISSKSYIKFAQIIGSYHPDKRSLLFRSKQKILRMKI